MFEGRHTFDAICLVAGTVLRRTKFVLAITAPSPIKCVGWCERMYVRICGGIAQQCFQHGLDYYLEVRCMRSPIRYSSSSGRSCIDKDPSTTAAQWLTVALMSRVTCKESGEYICPKLLQSAGFFLNVVTYIPA